jgi:hypothetical protein
MTELKNYVSLHHSDEPIMADGWSPVLALIAAPSRLISMSITGYQATLNMKPLSPLVFHVHLYVSPS